MQDDQLPVLQVLLQVLLRLRVSVLLLMLQVLPLFLRTLLLQLVLLPALPLPVLPLPVLPQVLLRFSESADDAPDSSCLCCSPDCVLLRIFSSLPELLLLF